MHQPRYAVNNELRAHIENRHWTLEFVQRRTRQMWKLPRKSDREGIRLMLNEGLEFGRENHASRG